MEDVIVYQTDITNKAEITEYYQHSGYEPTIVNSLEEISTFRDNKHFAKLFLEINNLSDILLLSSLKQIYNNSEFVLIIKPQLQEIINILRSGSYRTIQDLTKYNAKTRRQP